MKYGVLICLLILFIVMATVAKKTPDGIDQMKQNLKRSSSSSSSSSSTSDDDDDNGSASVSLYTAWSSSLSSFVSSSSSFFSWSTSTLFGSSSDYTGGSSSSSSSSSSRSSSSSKSANDAQNLNRRNANQPASAARGCPADDASLAGGVWVGALTNVEDEGDVRTGTTNDGESAAFVYRFTDDLQAFEIELDNEDDDEGSGLGWAIADEEGKKRLFTSQLLRLEDDFSGSKYQPGNDSLIIRQCDWLINCNDANEARVVCQTQGGAAVGDRRLPVQETLDENTGLSYDFENFILLSPNGQNGWSRTTAFDHVIVDPSLFGFGAEFGTRALRISNAIISGSFGDQTISPGLTDVYGGEAESVFDGKYVTGVRQPLFVWEFQFAAATTAYQPNLFFQVSADRGDGARMTYVGFQDTPAGIEIIFYDYQTAAFAAGTDSCCDGFVLTTIASGLRRDTVYTVRQEIEFRDGPSNDIVRVYLDGTLIHTGTTWEGYFQEAQSSIAPPPVDSLIFLTRGTPAPATSGFGFLIDNLWYNAGAVLYDHSPLNLAHEALNVALPREWVFQTQKPRIGLFRRHDHTTDGFVEGRGDRLPKPGSLMRRYNKYLDDLEDYLDDMA